MLGEPPPRLKPLDEKRQTKRKQTELLQDSTKGTSCQQMFSTSLETCSPGPPDRGVNQAIVSPNGKMIGRIPVRISCFYIIIVCCMLNVLRICLPLSAFTIPSICHINGSPPAWLQNSQSPVVSVRWTTNGTFRDHHIGLVRVVVGSECWHMFVSLTNKPVFRQLKSHRESSQKSLCKLVCIFVICLSVFHWVVPLVSMGSNLGHI